MSRRRRPIARGRPGPGRGREAANFAAALADQREDDHVGGGAARHHAEERALADAAPAEETETLTAAAREQRVDRAHAGRQRRRHAVALHRVHRRRMQRHAIRRSQRPIVQRAAERIHDAPEELRTNVDGDRALARNDAVAGTDAGHIAERHGQQHAVAEADDLHGQRRPGIGDDVADFADARARPLRLDQQANDAKHAALERNRFARSTASR